MYCIFNISHIIMIWKSKFTTLYSFQKHSERIFQRFIGGSKNESSIMWWYHERRSLYIFYLDNMEIWKDIPEYEWLYQVSNLWNVKSLWNGNSNNSKEKNLSPRRSRAWQSNVMLCKNATEKRYSISRLVAQWFLWLDISNTKICVCHKKEDLDDKWMLYNGADNLFLWTHAENMHDMVKKWRSPRSLKPVKQFTLDWNFIKEWESIKMAWRALNIDDTNIWRVLKWKWYTAGWFKWKYS